MLTLPQQLPGLHRFLNSIPSDTPFLMLTLDSLRCTAGGNAMGAATMEAVDEVLDPVTTGVLSTISPTTSEADMCMIGGWGPAGACPDCSGVPEASLGLLA
jgi:hypothetical protein